MRSSTKAMHFLFVLSIALANVASAEEYFLIFMEQHFFGDPELQLSVSLSNPTSSVVEATINFVSISQPNVTHILAPGESYSVNVSQDAILSGSAKHAKYIHISSSERIALYANTDYESTRLAAAGFMVLPVSSLTSQYLVATQCDKNKCVFAVTSTEDGNELTVDLRVSSGQALYGGKAYSDNDTVLESLNKGETMQVTCLKCDMTGTLLTGTESVAVFSGGEFTSIASIPNAFTDAVAEQMVPVETLGDRYTLLSNHTNPTLQHIVKIVLLKAGDQCTMNETTYTAARDRDVFIFFGHTANISEIVGSGPMFVCQFIFTRNNLGPGISLSLPQPRHQWKTSYDVYLPHSSHGASECETFLCLLLPAVIDPEWIHVSGGNASEVQSTPDGNYTVVWYTFCPGGGYHVQCNHSACLPFSGFVINRLGYRTSGYPLMGDWLYRFEEDDISTAAALTSQTSTSTEMITTNKGTVTNTAEPTSTTMSPTTQTHQNTTEGQLSSTQGFISQEDTTSSEPTTSIQNTIGIENVTLLFNVTSRGFTTSKSVVTTMQTSNISRHPLCSCVKNTTPKEVPTERRLQQFTVEIKANLTEDKKKLSSYIRTKMSMADPRKSSFVLGTTFGLPIFVVFSVLVFVPDIVTLIRRLVTLFCK